MSKKKPEPNRKVLHPHGKPAKGAKSYPNGVLIKDAGKSKRPETKADPSEKED